MAAGRPTSWQHGSSTWNAVLDIVRNGVGLLGHIFQVIIIDTYIGMEQILQLRPDPFPYAVKPLSIPGSFHLVPDYSP
jgi:hypothetical protein